MHRGHSSQRGWGAVLAGLMLACAAALVPWYAYLLAPTASPPTSSGSPSTGENHWTTDRLPAYSYETRPTGASRPPRPVPDAYPLTTPPGQPSRMQPPGPDAPPYRPYLPGPARLTSYIAGPAEPRAQTPQPGTVAQPNAILHVLPQEGTRAATRTPSQPAVQPAGIADSWQRIPAVVDEQTFDPPTRVKIPLLRTLPSDAVRVDPQSGRVTVAVRDAPLNQVLGLLAEQHGINIICSEDVTARISITIRNAPFDEALDAILSVAGNTALRQGESLLITSVANKGNVPPRAQGRETRLFVLDFVSAADADVVIKGLLSPVGQSFPVESDELDRRKTRELVVVEDLPAYLSRIDRVVRQLDAPPRQVLIEAHIMTVELEDDCHHGVDWSYIREANPALTLQTTGFADATVSPALIFDLDAGELAALIECLKTTTDAKTLASPKVFALNGQQARIQVGEQLGYRVITTTQTSSMESVEFLEVGVILTVTPQITPDNRVLMKVKPVVSSGQIDPDTKLPEEETTEVETSLILRDGHGIVIGGLIQEEDVEVQQKVPFLGDLWLVGRLFQMRKIDRRRTELIVTLIPHIVPYDEECYERESQQFFRATTPIVHGPLLPYPRPFEPSLPDASQPPPCLNNWRDWGSAAATVPDWCEGPPAGSREQSRPLPPAYYEEVPDPLGTPQAGETLPGLISEPSP